MIDYSLLGPEVMGFAPESPPRGHVRMRVQNPREFWEPWCAVGGQKFDHLRAPDGSVVVDVPREAVPGLSKAGYIKI
jgi:hypothetical protein